MVKSPHKSLFPKLCEVLIYEISFSDLNFLGEEVRKITINPPHFLFFTSSLRITDLHLQMWQPSLRDSHITEQCSHIEKNILNIIFCLKWGKSFYLPSPWTRNKTGRVKLHVPKARKSTNNTFWGLSFCNHFT